MEKLVRVIKLRPGETVLIVAEERPLPARAVMPALFQSVREGFPLPKGIFDSYGRRMGR